MDKMKAHLATDAGKELAKKLGLVYEIHVSSKMMTKLKKAKTKDGGPAAQVLPPSNVKGAVHIGHADQFHIEDMIIRCRRMSGYYTLWVPGMDHIGIATQVIVEKKIMRERNLTRHDLDCDNFVS